MKAMVINQYGGTEQFELAELQKPSVKSGHLLINIKASSVNTVDTMIRSMGEDLPFSPQTPAVLGMDFAGVVEEVGDGVSHFKVGDEVYGCAGGLGDLQGTLAEYMVADAQLVAHKPKSLSMREAAALPLVGITAYEGLVRAGVRKGQKVLVHGGAGGVGHIAIQLAKHFGADVYSTAGNDDHINVIQGLGAIGISYINESVSSYVEQYTDGNGFDVIFDSVGGENLAKSFEAAALNGQVATTVSLVDMDLSTAHMKGLSLHVVFMLIPMIHNIKRGEHQEILATLAQIVDSGHLTPILDKHEFNLEDAGNAHAQLESGKVTGKVVVTH